MSVVERPLRVVLFGDGESPHLLKWARALAAGGVDLWVASSRGFLPGFDGIVPVDHRLALDTPDAVSALAALPFTHGHSVANHRDHRDPHRAGKRRVHPPPDRRQ